MIHWPLYLRNHHATTVLRPFYRDHPGEPVPEENFWTLWCKGRLPEAHTPTIRLGATPSGLISAHLHHPHTFENMMKMLLFGCEWKWSWGKPDTMNYWVGWSSMAEKLLWIANCKLWSLANSRSAETLLCKLASVTFWVSVFYLPLCLHAILCSLL